MADKPFEPTHLLTLKNRVYYLMYVDRQLFTRKEWQKDKNPGFVLNEPDEITGHSGLMFHGKRFPFHHVIDLLMIKRAVRGRAFYIVHSSHGLSRKLERSPGWFVCRLDWDAYEGPLETRAAAWSKFREWSGECDDCGYHFTECVCFEYQDSLALDDWNTDEDEDK